MSERAYRSWLKWLAGASAMFLALAVVSVVYIFSRFSQQHMISMTVDGDRIIAATKSYIAATGRRPAQVSDLVPAYLAKLPESTIGWEQWKIVSHTGAAIDSRAFSVVREVDSGIGIVNIKYTSIMCYVGYDERPVWYAIPMNSNDPELVLRQSSS